MTTEIQIDPTRASDYETVFILRPDIDAEGSERVISRAVTAIEGARGKLTKVESWGKRRLAYPVAKQRKGVYVYVRYLGYQGTVTELERNLRMLDTVIRYMSVLLAKNVDFASVTVDPEEIHHASSPRPDCRPHCRVRPGGPAGRRAGPGRAGRGSADPRPRERRASPPERSAPV